MKIQVQIWKTNRIIFLSSLQWGCASRRIKTRPRSLNCFLNGAQSPFSQWRWLLNRSSAKKISWVVSKGILEWTGLLPLSFNGTEISSHSSPKWPRVQLPYEIRVKGYKFYILQVKFHLNYVAVLTVRHYFMVLGFLVLRQMYIRSFICK